MKITLTREEMLALWRRMRTVEPLRLDCSVGRTDSVDIDAILDGSIDKAPTKKIPFFDFVVPTELPGVDPKILDPRDTYDCACKWEEKAKDLSNRFIKNFQKFTGNEAGKALVAAGPKL